MCILKISVYIRCISICTPLKPLIQHRSTESMQKIDVFYHSHKSNKSTLINIMIFKQLLLMYYIRIDIFLHEMPQKSPFKHFNVQLIFTSQLTDTMSQICNSV